MGIGEKNVQKEGKNKTRMYVLTFLIEQFSDEAILDLADLCRKLGLSMNFQRHHDKCLFEIKGAKVKIWHEYSIKRKEKW